MKASHSPHSAAHPDQQSSLMDTNREFDRDCWTDDVALLEMGLWKRSDDDLGHGEWWTGAELFGRRLRETSDDVCGLVRGWARRRGLLVLVLAAEVAT